MSTHCILAIEPKGYDFCYNCAKMKGQKTFQYWYKSILFLPEKHNGTKANYSINSPPFFRFFEIWPQPPRSDNVIIILWNLPWDWRLGRYIAMITEFSTWVTKSELLVLWGAGANWFMIEILWHRRKTRPKTEKTNLNLQHREKSVYSTQLLLSLSRKEGLWEKDTVQVKARILISFSGPALWQ